MPSQSEPHLWEGRHPYYAQEGCFYSNECHENFDSWATFGWRESDADMNLLYRWDWRKPTAEDIVEAEEGGWDVPAEQLELYFMLQRKARPFSIYVQVTAADEPAVREWLTERAKTMAAIWNPIALPLDPSLLREDDDV